MLESLRLAGWLIGKLMGCLGRLGVVLGSLKPYNAYTYTYVYHIRITHAYTQTVTHTHTFNTYEHPEVWGIYFSVKQFPEWFRRKACAWWVVAVPPTRETDLIVGGVSVLARSVLEEFWSPSLDKWSFERTGMFINTSGGQRHIKFRFGSWIADEKAYKLMYAVPGASGLKPCLLCRNVVANWSRLDTFDPYFVPIHKASPAN
eukprot:1160166-Pyramimonas_sp.AAC.1